MYINSVGHRLRMFRLERNLTQQEVSKLTGIHTRTIYRIEHDKTSIRMNTLKKLAYVYGEDIRNLTE